VIESNRPEPAVQPLSAGAVKAITPQHLLRLTEQQAAVVEMTDLTVVERQTIEPVMRKTRGNELRPCGTLLACSRS
jgi:hypothetical protein